MKIFEKIVFLLWTYVCYKTNPFFCRKKKGPLHTRSGLSREQYYVFRINFSRHLGQVIEIFPFPLGTRTVWRHLGQLK